MIDYFFQGRHEDRIVELDKIDRLLILNWYLVNYSIMFFLIILIELGIMIDDVSERQSLLQGPATGKDRTHNNLIDISTMQELCLIGEDYLYHLEDLLTAELIETKG